MGTSVAMTPCKLACHNGIPEEALEIILSFVNDPRDRFSISLVCKKWYNIDNLTRKEITVAFCYTTTPSSLTRRFTGLQSLKVKGKPRAAMYNLMPEKWGAYAEPWVREITVNCPCLNSLHFRRMVVSDEDLLTVAEERRHMLKVLKLDRCSGFSTIGLEAIARQCRQLRELFLDESSIEDRGGKWLHEVALHNSSLEVLNFCVTNHTSINLADLETLAVNCKSLSSLKLYDVELSRLSGVLKRATSLKELGGVSLSGDANVNNAHANEPISLPEGLTSLTELMYMGVDNGDTDINSLVQPLALGLRKLDLQFAALSVEGHCQLLRHCSNLDALEVLDGIGDEGLEVVGHNCRNLKRLRVDPGIQQGYVTQRGLIAIARGCDKLEHIAMYMSDMNNAALEALGAGCPKLKDFRVVLLPDEFPSLDFPLDHGVHALLDGCRDLTRLALYLKPGALTNTGMRFIGKLGKKLRWALLGLLGLTDEGLSWLADGCPKLERLEMHDCVFTEAGISKSVLKMKSLKYIWVQGYKATLKGGDLLAMRSKPLWNIEFIPELGDPDVGTKPAQFLAYHSLAGWRLDCPGTVMCLA